MSKLTRVEVFRRFEAALAILGDEDCDDAQADLRIKNVRILLKRASRYPEVTLHDIANDASAD